MNDRRRRTLTRHRQREQPAETLEAAPYSTLTVWITAAVLGLIAFLLFTPSLDNYYLNWDDQTYVADNPYIARGLTSDAMAWSFKSGLAPGIRRASNWHPLTWMSHALDISFYGVKEPRGHYLTNILLHTVNTILIVVVLHRLTRRLWPAVFVAALFAVHPLHVESVSWLSERKDLLCALFMLLTIWAYAAYADQPSRKRYLLVFLGLAAALMSKPMAVTLPAVLLVLDYWPLERLSWRSVWEKIPLFALSAVSSVITFLAQRATGATASLDTVPLVERAANAIYAYGIYLLKAVVPWPGTLVPFVPLSAQGGPAVTWYWVLLSVGVMSAISALALWQAKQRPYLIVGWLIFVGMLVPVIGLVQVGNQLYADRYTYIPLVGVFMAVVWLVSDFAGEWAPRRRIASVVAVAALVALSVLTVQQQRIWRNVVNVWQAVTARYPRSAIAQNNLGQGALMESSRPGLSREQRKALVETYHNAIEAAVRADPDHYPSLWNLARWRLEAGRYPDAEKLLRHILEVKPDYVPAWNELGKLLSVMGKNDEAMVTFRKGMEEAQRLREEDKLNPFSQQAAAAIHMNMANVLDTTGHPNEALKELDTVLANAWELGSEQALAWEIRARILGELGRKEDALTSRQQALKVNPQFYPTLVNLGNSYLEQDVPDAALELFQRGMSVNPAAPEAYAGAGLALMRKGNYAAAAAMLEKAARIRPIPLIFRNLAIAYKNLGRNADAQKATQEAARLEKAGGQKSP